MNSQVKKKLELRILLKACITILALCITTFLSYLYIQKEKKDAKKEIETKISLVFGGKSEICDYQKESVSGELSKAGEVDFFRPLDEDGKSLVQYFKKASGGWKVLNLKNEISDYKLTISESADMGYKVPESYNIPSVNYGYNIYSQGYNISSNRPSIQEVYDNAMLYLTKQKDNNSYTPNSFNTIDNFQQIDNEYFYITSNKTVFESLSSERYIYTNKSILWYKESNKYYYITEYTKNTKQNWLKYSLISGLITFFLLLIWFFRKKI